MGLPPTFAVFSLAPAFKIKLPPMLILLFGGRSVHLSPTRCPPPPPPRPPPPPHPPTPRTTPPTLSVNRFVRYSSLALVASRSAPGFVKLLSGGALERWTRALVAQAAYLAPVDQMNRTLAQSASPPLLAPQLTPPHPLEAVGRDSRDSLLFPAA